MNQEQEKQQEILQAIVEALSQGVKPEEIAQVLVDKGMPQETAVQAIKMGMQYIQQNQQQGASDQFAQSMMGEQESELPDYAYGAAAALLANPQVLSSLISAAPAAMNMMNKNKEQQMFGGSSPLNKFMGGGYSKKKKADLDKYQIAGTSSSGTTSSGTTTNSSTTTNSGIPYSESNTGAPFNENFEFDINTIEDTPCLNGECNDAYNVIGGNNKAELALKNEFGIEDATPVSEDGTEIDYSKVDEAAERSKCISGNCGDDDSYNFENDYNPDNLNAVNALKEKQQEEEIKDPKLKQFLKNYKMDQTDARLMLLKESKNPWMNIAKGLTGMYIGGKDMVGDAIEGNKARKLGKQARNEMKSALSNAGKMASPKPNSSQTSPKSNSPQTRSMTADEKQDMYNYLQSQQPQTYTVDPNQQSQSVLADTFKGTAVSLKPGSNNIDWSNMNFEEGGFTPHMMYDPVTNKAYFAKTEDDHNKFASLGFKHEDEMKKGGGYIKYKQGGSYNNPGFNALPEWVQNKIKSNAKYGGLPKFQGTTGSSTVGGGTNVSNQPYSSAREEDFGVAYDADGKVDISETEDNFRRMYKPEVTDEQKQKDGSGEATFFWGWDMLNTGLEQRKERRRSERDQDKLAAINLGNTMQESPIVEQSSRGVNLTNSGIGAQSFLDKHTPDNLGYGTFTGKYGGMKQYKQGGSLTNYKQGDEVFMTKEQIDQFIRMGGVVEIVKDNE